MAVLNPVQGPEWPSSVCIRLTRACNARCAFCQAPDTHDGIDLSLNDVRRIARKLAAAGVTSVKLSGGEPTLRSDLPSIIREVHRNGLSVTIITNGIRVTAEIIDALLDTNGKIKFSVHYGDSRNNLVLGNTSFDKIAKNAIDVTASGVSLGVNSVVYRDNLDDIPGIADLALKWGASKVTFFPVVQRGLAALDGYTSESQGEFRDLVRRRVEVLKLGYKGLRIRCADFWKDPYWVIDHDGTLFVSVGHESNDQVIFCGKNWLCEEERIDDSPRIRS